MRLSKLALNGALATAICARTLGQLGGAQLLARSPTDSGKVEVSRPEKPIHDRLSELRGQTYWEVFWTQNKDNRPDDGANVDVCVKNWLTWLSDHGEREPSAHKTWIRSRCTTIFAKKARRHRLRIARLADAIEMTNERATEVARARKSRNRNQTWARLQRRPRTTRPDQGSTPDSWKPTQKDVREANKWAEAGKDNPHAVPPSGLDVEECVDNWLDWWARTENITPVRIAWCRWNCERIFVEHEKAAKRVGRANPGDLEKAQQLVDARAKERQITTPSSDPAGDTQQQSRFIANVLESARSALFGGQGRTAPGGGVRKVPTFQRGLGRL